MPNSLMDTMYDVEQRLRAIEMRFSDMGYSMTQVAQSEIKKKFKILPQAETYFGMHTAYCVDTIDPWKQNRVRFFSPLLHKKDVEVEALPYAYPISSMGGFDDCGLTWVPPAGSTLCITFEMGNRQSPFYMGTTWHRDRGPNGQHNWDYPVKEYYKIHEGKRGGYLLQPDDGSQVFPPWNTSNYNGLDIDSIAEFENDPEAQDKITYPHIYGFKTPQKHMVQLDDGNYKCNHRWSKMMFKSGGGNHFIMKDDPHHPAGQEVNPACGCGGGDVSECNDEDGKPLETLDCPPDTFKSKCANPYHKHGSECRPFGGPQTPQNNKCELEQTGIHLESIGGHAFWMDDKVVEPQGIPDWERGTRAFDFGCKDIFEGKTAWVSATGHRIEMNDKEERSQLRGEDNYIRFLSAAGNKIELNDESKQCPCGEDSGAPRAGEKRGITMTTTSRHIIQMIDEDNKQCAPCRREGGIPINEAEKAFIKIRTGYGLEMHFGDDFSQQETQQQFIQITAPQKDNTERGPHFMRFQEVPDGPGQVVIRVGGDYITTTYDNHYQVVGDIEENPSNKIRMVSKHTINVTDKVYYNVAEIHAFLADKIILLMAGKDCAPETGDECTPCVWPVLCLRNGREIVISDRVFASASPEAGCASIFQLLPFTLPCNNGPQCAGGERI